MKNTTAYIMLTGKLLNTFSVESGKGQGYAVSTLPIYHCIGGLPVKIK